MILSKTERTKLQKIIRGELHKIEKLSPENCLLLIISALISDFEELESVLSATYGIFASGKEIAELLDSLSGALSADLIDKLHFEGERDLIKNLMVLANNAQNLKFVLAGLHDKKNNIMQ